MTDASSAIIEVLKTQVDHGKLKDMVKYFQFSGVYNNPLISSAVNKFANKLNNFYGIDRKDAAIIANELIPPVMQELIQQSKSPQNSEFSLGSLLSILGGNRPNVRAMVSQLAV